MSNINKEIILKTLNRNRDKKYKVEFEELWRWCGYSRKDNAKRVLVKNLIEKEDYRLLNCKETLPDGRYSHKVEKITLTIFAAKMFAMLANTEQGRKVRTYFIEIEEQYRKDLEDTPQILSTGEMFLEISKVFLDHEKKIKQLEKNLKEVEDKQYYKHNAKKGEGIWRYVNNEFKEVVVSNIAVQQIGKYLVKHNIEPTSRFIDDLQYGSPNVNAFYVTDIKNAIYDLITEEKLKMYRPSRGKLQLKWHTEVARLIRNVVIFSKDKSLLTLLPNWD